MDARKLSFLEAVVGDDGARALAKAAAASEGLEWALFPRVVMAWLEVVSHVDYDEALPGTSDTRLSFRKHEGLFTGAINIGAEDYSFSSVSLNHVAGAVALALSGAPRRPPALDDVRLAKLGKSVDLLVKSRTLRKVQAAHQGGAKGVNLPGQAAAPRGPMEPTPPTSVQAKVPSQVGTKVSIDTRSSGANAKSSSAPKLPGVKPKRPTMKVSKAEATTPCLVCARAQFARDKYVGCACFAALAKSVRTVATDAAYVLEFGGAWDAEAITTLAEALGK